MEFYAEHQDSQDKFAILAIHDKSVQNFAELDTHLARLRASRWGGEDLPFPILLDGKGHTVAAFGVNAFPTTLLIDPEGKLVGHGNVEALRKHLPPGKPRPLAERIARAFDRQVFAEVNDGTLAQAIDALAEAAGVPIRCDLEALAASSVTPATRVPLQLRGRLSLRSWLELVLAAHRLRFVATADAIVVTTGAGDAAAPAATSLAQQACAEQIAQKLRRKVSFTFAEQTLAAIAEHFESTTGENFILDPVARHAGRLDPFTKVSGTAKDAPLGEALGAMLARVGVTLEVRQELVVLTPVAGK